MHWLAGGPVRAWLLPRLKLLLEWTCVPVLVVAAQLPQAAVLYWLSSLSFTLLQVSACSHSTNMHNIHARQPCRYASSHPTECRCKLTSDYQKQVLGLLQASTPA